MRVAIEGARSLHWVDLLQLIRTHYYHRDFHGSLSLKSVLPVLIPALGYEDLEIRDGATAARMFLETLRSDMSADSRDALRGDILAYCGRDTEAMVEIVKALEIIAHALREEE